MLFLPKWWKTWLTETEEEDLIKDPSKRVFTLGLLATAATLVLPASKPLEIVSSRDMRIPLQLRPGGNLSLAGIPYHQNDASVGAWLGLDRRPLGYADVVAAELDRIAPKLEAMFNREAQFYDLIKGRRPNPRSKSRVTSRYSGRKLGL